MGCRLPIVSRRMQEMSQVKEFIDFAAERNVLSCSADDAMQICTDLIEEYRSGSSRSRTNSTARTDETTVCSNCNAPISDGPRFSVDQGSSLPSRREQAIGEPQLDQEPSTADSLQERGLGLQQWSVSRHDDADTDGTYSSSQCTANELSGSSSRQIQ